MGRRRNSRNNQYTPLGHKVSSLCGTQRELTSVLGISQPQMSKRLRGLIEFSAGELSKLAAHFGASVTMFFEKPHMDSDTLNTLYRMFLYNPLALDWIAEAFRKDHSNIVELGEIAELMCKEE